LKNKLAATVDYCFAPYNATDIPMNEQLTAETADVFIITRESDKVLSFSSETYGENHEIELLINRRLMILLCLSASSSEEISIYMRQRKAI